MQHRFFLITFIMHWIKCVDFLKQIQLCAFLFLIDPLQTNQGMLSFKAYRLTKKLMDLYSSGEKNFTPEGLVTYYFVSYFINTFFPFLKISSFEIFDS